MTVAELIAELSKLDPAARVQLTVDRDDDGYGGDLTEVRVEESRPDAVFLTAT